MEADSSPLLLEVLPEECLLNILSQLPPSELLSTVLLEHSQQCQHRRPALSLLFVCVRNSPPAPPAAGCPRRWTSLPDAPAGVPAVQEAAAATHRALYLLRPLRVGATMTMALS